MALSLQAKHAPQYARVVRLLLKHGRRDLLARATDDAADLRDGGLDGSSDDDTAEAQALAADLESMGPTFVKLGQLLSTRADLLPAPYLDALARLQDKVEPVPFDELRAVVEDSLGVRLSKAFASFDEQPLAAASLGQVHRAVLRSGRTVAVKVQRPNIRGRIVDDLDSLVELATLVDKRTDAGRRFGFEAMVEEFRRAMLAELDYRREADNLKSLGAALAEFDRIVVPQPVDDYTNDRVLTMDLVDGVNLSSLGPVARSELDGQALGEQLFRAYVKQILVDGFFHADPHPGNVLVTRDDPPRLALIDLGMVARLSAELREQLVKLLLAVSEGRGAEAAAYAEAMSDPLDTYDRASFTRAVSRLVSEHTGSTVAQMPAGRIVAEMTRVAGDNGLRPAPELTLLGKALLNLDEIGRTLAPDFDPNDALRAEATRFLSRHLTDLMSPASVLTAALEAKDFAAKLPSRVSAVLDAVAEGEVRLNVKGIDEQQLMTAFQKVANRITSGLVIAALIVGAAMLTRVDTAATLFGYPALAIVCFLAAAAAGVALLVSSFRSDRRSR